MRRIALLLLKAAVSGFLLYFALRGLHIGELAARLRQTDLAWLLLAIAIMTVQTVLLGFRWLLVSRPVTGSLTLRSATELSFIGAFFSQVLPSTVGGDAVRLWLLARRGAGWKAAIYSVLIDRVAGVSALAVIVVACLPWTLALVRDPLPRAMLVLIGVGALGAAAVFVALGTPRAGRLTRFAGIRHLAEAAQLALTLCRTPSLASGIAVCSFAIHAMTVAAGWACVHAIGAPVGVLDILYLLPPVLLVSTVPVSIAGWGVRESSMVLAFGYAGLAQSDGLLLSILIGGVTFAVGAIGGVVWIAGGLADFRLLRAKVLPEQA